jgi:hypothetical protein
MSTEDAMSDAPTGRDEIPTRPETPDTDEEEPPSVREPVDADRQIKTIPLTPGRRRTDNVAMLVTEAEMVHEGHEPDNPAIPTTEAVGEQLRERLDEHADDLVPAWTRPWEGDE